MLTKLSFILVLMNALLVGCAIAGDKIPPQILPQAFPGFEFNQKAGNVNPTLSGYQYQSVKGGTIDIHNCNQARELDSKRIPEFEYFRFQQLLVSCLAVNRYTMARPSSTNYFAPAFNKMFFAQLPATTAPLLSKADLAQRQGKTFMQYDIKTLITMQDAQTAKLLTAEDEIYLTVLARGDFTHDGVEDLLVKSEWYARKAYGKHVDLLILTKTSKNAPVKIAWRMKPIK